MPETVQRKPFELLFSKEQLQAVLVGETFRSMHPNFRQKDALPPKDLTQDVISSILEKIQIEDLFVKRLQGQYMKAEFPTVSTQYGMIELVGTGESKYVFLFTSNEGKKIAVSMCSLGKDMEIQVPPNPKIHFISRLLSGYRGYYSDFHTYILLPFQYTPRNSEGTKFAVVFQEYAESKPTMSIIKITANFIARFKLKRFIEKYRIDHHYERAKLDMEEVTKPRHQFFIDGQIAFIDIPIEFS